MGVSTSAVAAGKEWAPATQPNMLRKVSKAGYDITPLTKEQRDAAAAQATPTTRCPSLLCRTYLPLASLCWLAC